MSDDPDPASPDIADVVLQQYQAEWLSLIRYQVDVADEHSREPSPIAMLGINALHDAVESMFGLTIEVYGITVPKNDSHFLALFDLIASNVSSEALERHRGGLNNLNQIRVGFKHHYRSADESTIERVRVNALDCLEDLSLRALGKDFHEVSLAGLIQEPEARSLVGSAESRWRAGEKYEALADLRRAFDRVINSYEQTKMWRSGQSLFDTQPNPSAYQAARMLRTAELGMFADPQGDYLERWIGNLQRQVKLLAFGVDMHRYAYLDAHAPLLVYTNTAPGGHTEIRDGTPEPTRDIFRRCHRFVVDTALQLAVDNFSFNVWGTGNGPSK